MDADYDALVRATVDKSVSIGGALMQRLILNLLTAAIDSGKCHACAQQLTELIVKIEGLSV
jgi:hypothetical protein